MTRALMTSVAQMRITRDFLCKIHGFLSLVFTRCKIRFDVIPSVNYVPILWEH